MPKLRLGGRVKSAFGVATRALARPLTRPPRCSFGIYRGACPRHGDAPTAEQLSRDQSAAGPTFMPGGPQKSHVLSRWTLTRNPCDSSSRLTHLMVLETLW